jgi:hypothetical protein
MEKCSKMVASKQMGVKTNITSFLRGNRSEITDWNTHVTNTIPTEYHHVMPRTYKRKSKPYECDTYSGVHVLTVYINCMSGVL